MSTADLLRGAAVVRLVRAAPARPPAEAAPHLERLSLLTHPEDWTAESVDAELAAVEVLAFGSSAAERLRRFPVPVRATVFEVLAARWSA